MPTIIDTTRKLGPCPWCGEPGRLMSRVGFDFINYQVGCVNIDCEMRSGTHSIMVDIDKDEAVRQAAMNELIKRWETRHETSGS